LKVVGAEYLRADDGSGRPEQLEFTITRDPQHGTLGLAGQTSTPVLQFTQADVRSQKVGSLSYCYQCCCRMRWNTSKIISWLTVAITRRRVVAYL